MATVITCEPIRGGGAMPRATINGQQFIECVPLRGGARTPDAKIGSGEDVINVKSWTPDQDDAEVPHGHTVKVNLEAINTEEFDVHYDEGSDFLDGEFDDTQVVADALTLITSPSGDDFEGYTPWTSPLGQGWTALTTGTSWLISNNQADSVQQVRHSITNKCAMRLDDSPGSDDFDMRMRFLIGGSTGGACYLSGRMSGSGSALRGYVCGVGGGSTGFYFGYYTGDGSTFGISINWTLGWTVQYDTWYWIRWKVGDNDTHYFKLWEEGTGEPDWQRSYYHATFHGTDVGVHARYGTLKYIDDFQVESIPPAYTSPGEWTHDVDVTAAEHFSHAMISWDEVVPTNTTATVYARWRDTDAWVQQTNGERITGIDLGDDMRAGATRDTLSLRVVLTTTDSQVTSEVSNLRVYFEPAARDQMEVVVHGVANTLAADTLLDWGMAWLRPVAQEPFVEVLDWSDLWFQTVKRWMARDEQTVTAALNYWGNLIESITFEAEAGPKYRHGHEPCEWVVPALVMASGPNIYEWTALTPWWPMGHNFTWNIIDKGQAIHADYRWLVGHAQLDDHPLSFLLAVPNITDHPLSVLAKAFARNDHPLSMLVQGWKRDDYPLSFLVGEWTINDHPVSMLSAIEYLDDHPMSFLVYGVSREGMIEVNVIDDATWDELVALGYTRS